MANKTARVGNEVHLMEFSLYFIQPNVGTYYAETEITSWISLTMLSIYYKGSQEWLALMYTSTSFTDCYMVQGHGVFVHMLHG